MILVRAQPQKSSAPRIEGGPGPPSNLPAVALRIGDERRAPAPRPVGRVGHRGRASGDGRSEDPVDPVAGVDRASEGDARPSGRVAAPGAASRSGRAAERAPAGRRRGETRSRSLTARQLRPAQRPVERAENAHVPRAQRDDGQSGGNLGHGWILPEPTHRSAPRWISRRPGSSLDCRKHRRRRPARNPSGVRYAGRVGALVTSSAAFWP